MNGYLWPPKLMGLVCFFQNYKNDVILNHRLALTESIPLYIVYYVKGSTWV